MATAPAPPLGSANDQSSAWASLPSATRNRAMSVVPTSALAPGETPDGKRRGRTGAAAGLGERPALGVGVAGPRDPAPGQAGGGDARLGAGRDAGEHVAQGGLVPRGPGEAAALHLEQTAVAAQPQMVVY